VRRKQQGVKSAAHVAGFDGFAHRSFSDTFMRASAARFRSFHVIIFDLKEAGEMPAIVLSFFRKVCYDKSLNGNF
jgi:hypothetical protein